MDTRVGVVVSAPLASLQGRKGNEVTESVTLLPCTERSGSIRHRKKSLGGGQGDVPGPGPPEVEGLREGRRERATRLRYGVEDGYRSGCRTLGSL